MVGNNLINQNELPVTIAAIDQRWQAFIETRPEANTFHHPVWLDLLAKCYGYRPFEISVRDGNDQILAGIPVMEITNLLFGKRWVSLPFSDHCAPLQMDAQSYTKLIDGLITLFHHRNLSRVELRWDIPERDEFQLSSQFALHTLPLQPDAGLVAKGFDRIHRQNIRQAENNQVKVEWGNQLKDMRQFYLLQLETRRRHGMPSQPWRFFRLLYEELIKNGFGSVVLAYKDEQCIAGIILFHWQQTLMCKYAASREETMKLRPNNLLFWTAIQWGCENGYTVFDMGRTDLDNPGLCRFKLGWGAVERKMNYFDIKPELTI